MHTLSFVAKNARRRAFCASIIRVQCSTSYKSYWCLQVVNSLSGNLWQPPVQLYCSLLKQQVAALSGHLLKGQDCIFLCHCVCVCVCHCHCLFRTVWCTVRATRWRRRRDIILKDKIVRARFFTWHHFTPIVVIAGGGRSPV